jgi:phosphoribosyl-ATP pyrophosphohydrolase/phosphoribosyl-AMP cyclohydrolase
MHDDKLAFLRTLEELIIARHDDPPDDSYTASLFASGTQRIAQKVGEEGIEVALAACNGEPHEVTNEAADLLYHLLVLLADRGIRFANVVATLESRHSAR